MELPTRVKGARTHENRHMQHGTPEDCESHTAQRSLILKAGFPSSFSVYKPTCYCSKYGFSGGLCLKYKVMTTLGVTCGSWNGLHQETRLNQSFRRGLPSGLHRH